MTNAFVPDQVFRCIQKAFNCERLLNTRIAALAHMHAAVANMEAAVPHVCYLWDEQMANASMNSTNMFSEVSVLSFRESVFPSRVSWVRHCSAASFPART